MTWICRHPGIPAANVEGLVVGILYRKCHMNLGGACLLGRGWGGRSNLGNNIGTSALDIRLSWFQLRDEFKNTCRISVFNNILCMPVTESKAKTP